MAKAKLKTFRVQKRFEVWVEREVQAEDFDAAVVLGRALTSADFLDATDDTVVNDIGNLPGFGVQENF